MEINEDDVYTTDEVRSYLKLSNSTITRMIRDGLISAAKVGKQYRIKGKEVLRIVSPKLEDKVGIIYNKGRRWVHNEGEFKPKNSEKKHEK